LALLLKATDRAAEAEMLIRRALELGREIYGASHPRIARRMQILAGILKDMGRSDEAELLASQSLEIFEQALGPHHPRTQSSRRDLESLTTSE
jgi:nephrocystin-3